MQEISKKLCPRTKGKGAPRAKLAITMDPVLYEKLQVLFEQGYTISHVIDSALWHFLGKPKLSFELEEKKEG